MKDVPTKNTGDELSANEYSLCTSQECQNQVKNTGQTLSEANLEQLTQSTVLVGNNAIGYEDTTGVVSNNYLLSVRTQFNNVAPTSLFNGFNIFFEVVNANTGDVTLNVESLGVTSLVDSQTQQLAADTLVPNTTNYAFYDGTNFVLGLINATDAAFKAALADQDISTQGDKLVGHTGETVFSAINARPTSTTLSANGGAALIGTTSSDTVQDELDKTLITIAFGGTDNSTLLFGSGVSFIKGGPDLGIYEFTFTVAEPDTNYIIQAISIADGGDQMANAAFKTTAGFTIRTFQLGTAIPIDTLFIDFTIWRARS